MDDTCLFIYIKIQRSTWRATYVNVPFSPLSHYEEQWHWNAFGIRFIRRIFLFCQKCSFLSRTIAILFFTGRYGNVASAVMHFSHHRDDDENTESVRKNASQICAFVTWSSLNHVIEMYVTASIDILYLGIFFCQKERDRAFVSSLWIFFQILTFRCGN